MKIAIDLHGTIDKYPDAFRSVMKMLVSAGVEVFVMSGPEFEVIFSQLKELGFKLDVHFTGVHSVVEFLKSGNTQMRQDEKGRWWASDKDWWSSKGKLCKFYKIDILVDNELKYKSDMPETTNFVHFTGVQDADITDGYFI